MYGRVTQRRIRPTCKVTPTIPKYPDAAPVVRKIDQIRDLHPVSQKVMTTTPFVMATGPAGDTGCSILAPASPVMFLPSEPG